MLKISLKYLLPASIILTLSACNERTIVLTPNEVKKDRVVRSYPITRPPIIQEEITIPATQERVVVVKEPRVAPQATPVAHRSSNSNTTPIVSNTHTTTVTPTNNGNTVTTGSENPTMSNTPNSVVNSSENSTIENNTQISVPMNHPTLGSVATSPTEVVSEEVPSSVLVEPTEVNSGRMGRIDFPVEEYNHLRKTGRSTLSGSIYLTNGTTNTKIVGQNVKLYLNPITSYSRQWYEESYLGGYKMSKSDPRLFNYLKFTVSKGDGKFNFFGIASGDYYLVGTIKCAQECGYATQTTVRLVKEISIGRGVTRTELTKTVP